MGATRELAPVGAPVGGTVTHTHLGGGPTAPNPRRDRRQFRGRGWLIALGVTALLVAVGSIAYALTSSSPPSSPTRPGTASHQATTTTSTSTTTTTTTLPTAPTALAALVRDVAAGVTAGSISSNIAQSLTNLAQRAITDAAAGSPDQTARDLQQAATLITNGEQNGVIQPTEGSTLQSDLSSLAGALGLSAAGTAPSTTSTTVAAHGKGHDGGPGGGG
jgi:hypothetical protein